MERVICQGNSNVMSILAKGTQYQACQRIFRHMLIPMLHHLGLL